MIYSTMNVTLLLGAMCNDSTLSVNPKYPLQEGADGDFSENLFHRLIFSAIKNMTIDGAKVIEVVDIDTYIKSHWVSHYEVFKDNKGGDYISTAKQLGSVLNYELYWESVRKYSLIRDCIKNNVDVSDVWNIDAEDEENAQSLGKYSLVDIIKKINIPVIDITRKYHTDSEISICDLGDDYDEWLEEQAETPMVGAGLCSPTLNALYRGWVKGHLILRGAPSSFGKTTMGIADAVNVSMKRVWNDKQEKYVDNPYYQGKGAYIHTEQTSKELGHRFASTISGIPYHIILDGKYKDDASLRSRLSEAGRIMKESGFRLINYPTFTITGIKDMIKNLSMEGFEYITHDYMWNNLYICSDLKESTGVAVNEAQALLQLASTLKLCAETYNVAVATMCQLNDSYKEALVIDEGCLYGSKAIKNKLDCGSCLVFPRQKELAQAKPLIDKWNEEHGLRFDKMIQPNGISHVFKGRYSRWGQNIKVYHFLDHSKGRMYDMFATTFDGRPINIEPFYILNEKSSK